jgi:hypothetical protein
VLEEHSSYAVTGDGASPVHVAAALAEQDVWPRDFRTERATLEDIFVSLTSGAQR